MCNTPNKKSLVSIIFLMLCGLSFSQHSKNFKELVKDIGASQIKTDTTYYENGKIFMIASYIQYQYDNKDYSWYTGRLLQFHKNGKPMVEADFDVYGNQLSYMSYDDIGNKKLESITIEIDSKAKNLMEFFKSEQSITLRKNESHYKCSSKLQVCYIAKEGQTVNGKKVGLWKFYEPDGSMIKEKSY